jgi:hypothetical protein
LRPTRDHRQHQRGDEREGRTERRHGQMHTGVDPRGAKGCPGNP